MTYNDGICLYTQPNKLSHHNISQNISKIIKKTSPSLFPNTGCCGNIERISFNAICSSFHLNTNVPCFLNTLMHSLKPCVRSSFQFEDSFPYFKANLLQNHPMSCNMLLSDLSDCIFFYVFSDICRHSPNSP